MAECTNSDELLAEILPQCTQNFEVPRVFSQLRKFDPEINEFICSELLNEEMFINDFM